MPWTEPTSTAVSKEHHESPRPRAWLISFGPVGSGSDGYLIRTETNARALVEVGFAVEVLEVSARREPTEMQGDVQIHPAAPDIVVKRRILGPIDPVATLREQLGIAVGLIRNRKGLRSSEVVIVEGGLLWLAFVMKVFRRKHRPIFVFDLITLMSSLHRDHAGRCTLRCRFRRAVWRVLELACVRSADLSVAGGPDDALGLSRNGVVVIPHVIAPVSHLDKLAEDVNLIAFLGSGHVVPNREALYFVVSTMHRDRNLAAVRCRVIGDRAGYEIEADSRLEFVGFHKDPAAALEAVSVGCAPMDGAGGVSTKVLAYLAHGKRTVCTPEAAHGIATPPFGLWIADRDHFPEALAAALAFPWSLARARELQEWMAEHHGPVAVKEAWSKALASTAKR